MNNPVAKTILVGAIGVALVNIWNTSVHHIINLMYPVDEIDTATDKAKRVAAYVIYVLAVTLLALLIIKILI